MSERFKFFEEIEQVMLYLQDKEGLLPIPECIDYSDELHQKGISPLEHIMKHYMPSMFSNNKKLITQIVHEEEPLDDRPLDNYCMKEKDSLEKKLLELEIGNSLMRLDRENTDQKNDLKKPTLREEHIQERNLHQHTMQD
jgi:hypothetical protein